MIIRKQTGNARRKRPFPPPSGLGHGSGFTLIEVLVVVAIIALLVSVLVPSLALAREQARSVKCLANFNQLGVASSAYLNANQDVYCWGRFSGRNPITSHYYGGKRGKGGEGSLYIYGPGQVYDYLPSERPLNKYVTVAKLGDAVDLRVYECPSDKGCADRTVPNAKPTKATSYDVMGTSYDSNVMWDEYVRNVDTGANRIDMAKSIIRIFRKKGASRVILLHEDPSDVALGGMFYGWPQDLRIATFHGKLNWQNICFLDGHAAAVLVTPKYILDYRRNTPYFQVCAPSGLPSPFCANGTATWIARQDYGDR